MENLFAVSVMESTVGNVRLGFRQNISNATFAMIERRSKMEARKQKRWEIFREKRWKKYGEKNAKRRERGKAARIAFREMVENSPDWICLKDWGVWIEKSFLVKPYFQGLVIALQNNPSYSTSQKRHFVQTAVNAMKRAENLPAAERERLELVFAWEKDGELPKFYRPGRTPPDDYVDTSYVLPPTYEEMIAAAEADMPPEEIKRKYELPAQPYPKPAQY